MITLLLSTTDQILPPPRVPRLPSSFELKKSTANEKESSLLSLPEGFPDANGSPKSNEFKKINTSTDPPNPLITH